MAQKPPGKTSGEGRVTFTKASAERIADAVRAVEAGNRDGLPYGNSPRLESSPGAKVRLGTFTGSWATGTYKTVTLKDSTTTVSVFNWCNASPEVGCGSTATTQNVVFTRIGGTHSVLELPSRLDPASIAGFKSSEIQILGHGTAGPPTCLMWYDIATCSVSQ